MQDRETLTLNGKSSRAEQIPLRFLKEEELIRLSNERMLSFSIDEMRAVQNYFRSEERDPTDVELETIAQTWSEHCKHKTFKGIIDYSEQDGKKAERKVYDDLLKETIVRATQEINADICLSVFKDNAGMIAFDDKNAVAFKVETHNHPSALEPYGGSGTGVGGVIRDILGAGLGAKPILNTDVFCVAPLGTHEGLGEGMLPPERILSGLISGVRDYGNRMGIPTSNGAVFFHEGFLANPLVFCGTVGVMPKDKIEKRVVPGDWVVAIGGRTGRDGIHGATFSSLELKKGISASVVQIGNAIIEKKVADAILRARDRNLYHAITDCGAGGFSSAVGELASDCGAEVHLEKALLKYEGLAPWEIWLSESQERMVLSIPKGKFKEFETLCAEEDVECSILGTFTDDRRLNVFYDGEKVCDLDIHFMHDGIPRVRKQAVWKKSAEVQTPSIEVKEKEFGKILKQLIAHPNIASKRWIVRQYDHEVQGGSVIKPFAGANLGPSDACVTRPVLDSWKGVVISNGINPLYGEIDPYWMAANAIDEALRNLVAVGGSIDHCAILDNFCWGNIHDPEILGGLVRSAQACYDFSKAFKTPFISGKDSLNNTWRGQKGQLFSIPGTLLISAIGVIDDARRCVTMDFKSPGNLIVVLGETKNELGRSHLHRILGVSGGEVPKVDAKVAPMLMRKLHQAIRSGWIRACHDISEGGLAVSIAEMSIGGLLGAQVQIPENKKISDGAFLFSESTSRWVLEIEPVKLSAVKKCFGSLPFEVIGNVQKNLVLQIKSKKEILKASVTELQKLWNQFSERQ